MVAAYTAEGVPAATTKADRRRATQASKRADARYRELYELGRKLEDPPEGMTADERQAYEAGRDDNMDNPDDGGPEKASADRLSDKENRDRYEKEHREGYGTHPYPDIAGGPGPRPSGPSSGSSRRSSSSPLGSTIELGHQGAGFLLGLIVYAVAINYLRYGTPGVKAWLSAKFLNKPAASATVQGQSGYIQSQGGTVTQPLLGANAAAYGATDQNSTGPAPAPAAPAPVSTSIPGHPGLGEVVP